MEVATSIKKMDFKKNLNCCNIYKLYYLLKLHMLLITSTQDDVNLCHEIKYLDLDLVHDTFPRSGFNA